MATLKADLEMSYKEWVRLKIQSKKHCSPSAKSLQPHTSGNKVHSHLRVQKRSVCDWKLMCRKVHFQLKQLAFNFFPILTRFVGAEDQFLFQE